MRIIMYKDKTFALVDHTTIELSTNPIVAEVDVTNKSDAEIEIIKQHLLDANN